MPQIMRFTRINIPYNIHYSTRQVERLPILTILSTEPVP